MWKCERLEDIHNLELSILQSLRFSSRLCIGYHGLADIDPYHLYLRVGASHVEYPAARPTGEIEYRSKSIWINFWRKQSPHVFCNQNMLVDQAGHLGHTFRVHDICVFSLLAL